jgi:hypothetical protein
MYYLLNLYFFPDRWKDQCSKAWWTYKHALYTNICTNKDTQFIVTASTQPQVESDKAISWTTHSPTVQHLRNFQTT